MVVVEVAVHTGCRHHRNRLIYGRPWDEPAHQRIVAVIFGDLVVTGIHKQRGGDASAGFLGAAATRIVGIDSCNARLGGRQQMVLGIEAERSNAVGCQVAFSTSPKSSSCTLTASPSSNSTV